MLAETYICISSLFAGGPDEAVRQPEERGDRHQEPQVVRPDRVDCRLPEEGG